MHLKRTSAIAVLSMILVLVFCLSKEVKASTLYQTSITATSTGSGAGSLYPNGSADGVGNSELPHVVWQELNINPSAAEPIIVISDLVVEGQFKGTQGSCCSTPNVKAYLLNTVDWNAFVATGYDHVVSSRATSSYGVFNFPTNQGEIPFSNRNYGSSTYNFTSPYTVDVNNDIKAFVLALETKTSYSKPIWRTVVDTYPSNSAFTFLWSGGAKNTNYNTYFNDSADLAFQIYINNDLLTIDEPSSGEVKSTAFQTYGNCPADVNLVIHSGLDLASSTYKFYSNPQCLYGEWSQLITNLTDGRWWITATTSLAGNDYFSRVGFFWGTPNQGNATSTDPDDVFNDLTLNASCYIPFLSFDPCSSFVGFLNTLRNSMVAVSNTWLNNFKSAKPFSYLPQIYNTVYSAATNENTTTTMPLATLMIPTSSPYFHPTINLFSASTLTEILPEEKWNLVRPYITTLLYILFIMYLWRRFLHA